MCVPYLTCPKVPFPSALPIFHKQDYVSYTITESIAIRDVCVYIVCLDGKLSVSKSNSAGLYTRGYDMYFLKHSDAGFG